MKSLWLMMSISLILISTTALAGTVKITVPVESYNLRTEKNIDVYLFEMGLSCRVYSKFRIFGIPANTREETTDTYERFVIEQNAPGKYTLKPENPLNLNFWLNELTSYVHACTFLVNIDALVDGLGYSARGLNISDFVLKSKEFNAQKSFSKALQDRGLIVNKHVDELRFQ